MGADVLGQRKASTPVTSPPLPPLMTSDYKVETVNDGMQEFFVEFSLDPMDATTDWLMIDGSSQTEDRARRQAGATGPASPYAAPPGRRSGGVREEKRSRRRLYLWRIL